MTITTDTGITIEKSSGKTNIMLDMSQWDLFELCHFRYDCRYNKNRAVPIIDKSDALDSGSLIHEGYDVYYSQLQQGIHFNDRMQACLMKISAFAAHPDQCSLSEDDVKLVLKAVEQNLEFWRFEDETMTIHEVERPFMFVLYEDDFIRILITGKIDVLISLPKIGQRSAYNKIPMDHKSYKRDFEVLRLTNQFMNYSYATESKYLYVNRVGLHNPDAKTPKPVDEKFYRVMLSYDAELLEEWRQNLIRGILDEYLTCIASGVWRQNFTSCYKFNRTCEYYGVCDTSGKENKERKLTEGYQLMSPWDVTATFNKKREK